MRKLFVALLALGLVVALAMPASALENIFGGYWRTRMYTEQNYTGEDQTEAADVTQVDTRTRLYYTAKFSDNFKFVNKFEFDTVWGDTIGGDIGTDGKGTIEFKHSYADFTLAPVNVKVGLQPWVLGRGFLFDDDGAGLTIKYAKDNLDVSFVWLKAYEGGYGKDANDKDVDLYVLAPIIKMDKITLSPYVVWETSEDISGWLPALGAEKTNVYYLGADVDAALGKANVWFTGIYEFGSADPVGGGDSIDVSAWLVALGADAEVGPASVRGQFIYVTGEDLKDTSTDITAFTVMAGQSYDWAVIMGGNGIFDNQNSAGSCGPTPSNLMALNVGATMKPMDKLAVALDLWYATLVEDNAAGDTDLGTEVDLTITYNLIENMDLDVVGAYLFAGDATYKGDNDADPYLLGTRLSFSF